MISLTAVDRLMQLGQQRGGLQIDDIREALPVDTMTTAELSNVLARLEEAGISVDIDPALLSGHHQKKTLRGAKYAPDPLPDVERMTGDHGRLAILASSIKAVRDSSSRTPGTVLPRVLKSGTAFVLGAAFLLLLIALSVWRLG